MKGFEDLYLTDSQGQNLAVTALHVPCSLDSGEPLSQAYENGEHSIAWSTQGGGNPSSAFKVATLPCFLLFAICSNAVRHHDRRQRCPETLDEY